MKMIRKNNELPEDHWPYTDKYFLRSNEILIHERLNPRVSMKVFARGQGKIAGLEDAVDVLLKYSDLKDKKGEIWVSKDETYRNKNPLMIIKGPIQSFIELETMYLGVLSSAISRADGISDPEPEHIKDKLKRLKNIYEDIPITYFGARHYHWSLDKEIAKAALEGGAINTSTDIGSSNIGKYGVGTMPHALILTLAYYYGKDRATVNAARLFNQYFGDDVPVITLVDTFNRELTDSLMAARYFHDTKKTYMRLDTCGENIGEDCSTYNGRKEKDPEFRTGTGVTIELASKLRLNLIKHAYGDYTDTILTSGFGDEEKAKVFVKAQKEFKKSTGYDLFTGVGIGEVSKAKFCTADIFEIEGKPFSKVGRDVNEVDYSKLERVV